MYRAGISRVGAVLKQRLYLVGGQPFLLQKLARDRLHLSLIFVDLLAGFYL